MFSNFLRNTAPETSLAVIQGLLPVPLGSSAERVFFSADDSFTNIWLPPCLLCGPRDHIQSIMKQLQGQYLFCNTRYKVSNNGVKYMSNINEKSDQTEEIIQDLLHAERQQEITQVTTLQGQIISLVIVLRDLGLLKKTDINHWEILSETITDLLSKMAHAVEVQHSSSNDMPEQQLHTMLEGTEATIEFTRMMGNSEEAIQPLLEQRNKLISLIEESSNNET
jgi:hypothetical protein